MAYGPIPTTGCGAPIGRRFLLPLVGHYELVEGRVLKAEKTGGRVYLNFGRRFKEDFTAVIDARGAALFADEQIDPLKLSPARWCASAAGSTLKAVRASTVTHPEQIEMLARP